MWELSVIIPVGGKTGHLTDEMESEQFECTIICEALFSTP